MSWETIKKMEDENSVSTTELLAFERSILANERTILAYVRTCLSIFVAGVSLIQFFQFRFIVVTGYILLPIGAMILIIGILRYIKANKAINSFRKT